MWETDSGILISWFWLLVHLSFCSSKTRLHIQQNFLGLHTQTQTHNDAMLLIAFCSVTKFDVSFSTWECSSYLPSYQLQFSFFQRYYLQILRLIGDKEAWIWGGEVGTLSAFSVGANGLEGISTWLVVCNLLTLSQNRTGPGKSTRGGRGERKSKGIISCRSLHWKAFQVQTPFILYRFPCHCWWWYWSGCAQKDELLKLGQKKGELKWDTRANLHGNYFISSFFGQCCLHDN